MSLSCADVSSCPISIDSSTLTVVPEHDYDDEDVHSDDGDSRTSSVTPVHRKQGVVLATTTTPSSTYNGGEKAKAAINKPKIVIKRKINQEEEEEEEEGSSSNTATGIYCAMLLW